MAHTRRDFIKGSICAMSLSMIAPKLFVGARSNAFAQQAGNGRVLVVLQLDGGNDGLNTIVPYTDSTYYSARPTLAIPEASVLKATDKLGFHPVMTKFKSLFDQGRVAVVQNTGYPTPDLSHFRSRIIYHRADPNTQESFDELGWLGRYADLKLANSGNPLSVVNFGQSVAKSLISEKAIPASILDYQLYQFQTDTKFTGDRNNQINAFKKSNGVMSNSPDFLFIEGTGIDAVESSDVLQTGIKKYNSSVTYPASVLGRQLQMAAQLIAADLGTQILHITAGGFDTHSQQKADHEELLTNVSDGLEAFYRDLTQLGKANNVLVMAFSEFGRRVNENGSAGTDHGASGPMFILGNAVKGGFYGQSPSLTNLDNAGNTKFDIDFRAVYGTIVSDWLQSDPVAILGSQFENIGFLNK
jgi:uncharacterized protein (DUF1501 family)